MIFAARSRSVIDFHDMRGATSHCTFKLNTYPSIVKHTLLSLALAVFAGCAQKSATEAPAAPIAAPAAAKTAAAASSEAPQEVDRTATQDRLTQVLRRYSAETQRVPKSLDELVTAGYLPELPAAPAGKKYVFDQQLRVTLK